MRKAIVALGVLFLAVTQVSASDGVIGGIRLLEGYKVKKQLAVDAFAGKIEKEGGATIEFEAGPSEGPWANPGDMKLYAWYKEQTINGHKVMIALIKPGLRTGWEPDSTPVSKPGSILLVTFPLGGSPDNTANFKGKISSPEDLADMLLMVLTFDPSKLIS
jgi:hypothetical protein